MIGWLEQWRRRRRAQKLLRQVDPSKRPRIREIAARVCNEASSDEDAENLAGEILASDIEDQGARFGIAEILLLIRLIVAIYQLFESLDLLRRATPALVSREVRE